MNLIATIGYEGASPDAFDAALLAAGVDLVVDVRAVAISRKRGFSKSALADRLRLQGLDYIHLRGLGDPKPGREAARAGDMAQFLRVFNEHMGTAGALAELETLRGLACERRVALLCYEANASGCHRAVIANNIAKLGNLEIVHLQVDQGRTTGVRSRANDHSREGLAAA